MRVRLQREDKPDNVTERQNSGAKVHQRSIKKNFHEQQHVIH